MKPTDYLAKHGRLLIESGYDIVPIGPGTKYPAGIKNWETLEITQARLRRWLENGHEHDGVGIRTAKAPAVDIDVKHARVARELEDWCQAHIGFAPVRVGLAPKRLLAYRADTPFPKLASVWLDADGKEQKVEILGEGQQYVAWAIHPDTKKPYEWQGRNSLLTIPLAELEPIDIDAARRVLAEFDRIAEDAGWTPKMTASGSSAMVIPTTTTLLASCNPSLTSAPMISGPT